jgi:hypothetical protein
MVARIVDAYEKSAAIQEIGELSKPASPRNARKKP